MRAHRHNQLFHFSFTASLAVLLLLHPLFAIGQVFSSDRSLRELAETTRFSLARRIETPVAQLNPFCLPGRTETAPMREYLLRQQGLAIEALLASSTQSAESRRVRKLLANLQLNDYNYQVDRRLVDSAPGGAEGLRLAASLGELPAALESRLASCVVAGRWSAVQGRTSQPLGELARTDYGLLVEMEPGDLWHPLVLAWLAGLDGDPMLERALAVAKATPGEEAARVRIFALQQLAWLRRQQGPSRWPEAQQAAQEAMALANERLLRTGADLSQPAARLALRDAAQTGSALALTLEATGRSQAAIATLNRVASQQRQLASQDPADLTIQIALIESLARPYLLETRLGESPESYSKQAGEQFVEASNAMTALWLRTPLDAEWRWKTINGILISSALMAAGFTLLLGWILLRLYRYRIARLMRCSSHGNGVPAPSQKALPPAEGSTVSVGRWMAEEEAPPSVVSPMRIVAGQRRRAAIVQITAGLVFAAVAAGLWIWESELEFTPRRYAFTLWPWALPMLLALGMVWEGEWRRYLLAWGFYLGALIPFTLVLLSPSTAAVTTPGGLSIPPVAQAAAFLVMVNPQFPIQFLFLNRTWRSIAPALFLTLMVLTLATSLATLAGGMPIVRHSILMQTSPRGIPVDLAMALPALLGLIAGVPLALIVIRLLRQAYIAKWMSDQILMINTLWALQATYLALALSSDTGPVGFAWSALLFLSYSAIAFLGMVPAWRGARRRQPLRLLLLRVFTRWDQRGRQRSRRDDAERLFAQLASRWRAIGPITMIGAPDLASSTFDPAKFLDFLVGRLHKRFILDPAELPAWLARLDDRPDPDGRWRVDELFCGNDSWQAAVLALMSRSDRVVMDLRDFGPDNQGCLFELQALMNNVPSNRCTLIIDNSTRLGFLETTIDNCLASLQPYSPNMKHKAAPILIDIEQGHRGSVEQVLKQLVT